jgi:cell division initiation protein
MPVTPVEIRHLELRRGLLGYKRGVVHRMMDDIADSFEAVWRERAELVERVEALESELGRHVELEELLRSTLVSAERAAHDVKDQARREADVIVGEANAEARRILREAIAEKEALLGEVRKIRSLLRSALDVVGTVPDELSEEPVARPAPVAPAGDSEPTDPGIRRIAG